MSPHNCLQLNNTVAYSSAKRHFFSLERLWEKVFDRSCYQRPIFANEKTL